MDDRPTTIILADGSSAEVRFDFRSMIILEEQFESVMAFAQALDERHLGKGFAAVLAGLRASTAFRTSGVTAEQLHVDRFETYREALVEAFFAAMPPLPKTVDEVEENKSTWGAEGDVGPEDT